MTVFKLNDKIECVNPGNEYLTKGEVYTVNGATAYWVLASNDRGNDCWYDPTRFKLYEEKAMKKSDLRTGDLIVLNAVAGIVRVYKDTEQGDIVAGSAWYPLKDYSDDRLFNWTTESIYGDQFLEVWRPKSNSAFPKAEPSEYTHVLIWKKEVLTPEQRQLQEVMTKIFELQSQAEKLQDLINK